MRFFERDMPETQLISGYQEFPNWRILKIRKKHDFRLPAHDNAVSIGNTAPNILQFQLQALD